MSEPGNEAWIVRRPTMEWLGAPKALLNADVVEIRVSLTPLRYYEQPVGELGTTMRLLQPCGDACYSQVSIDRYIRVEAKDTRIIFHLMRELILLMVKQYLGVEL